MPVRANAMFKFGDCRERKYPSYFSALLVLHIKPYKIFTKVTQTFILDDLEMISDYTAVAPDMSRL